MYEIHLDPETYARIIDLEPVTETEADAEALAEFEELEACSQ